MDELSDRDLKNKFFQRAISKAINDKKILYSKNVDHHLSEIVEENFNLISKEGELLASIPLEDLKNQGPNGCLLGCIGLPAFLAIISAIIIPYLDIGFWPMTANSSRAKSVLVEAIKDCLIKNSDGIDKPTFEDIGLPEMPPHSEWPQDTFSFYTDSSFSNPIQKSDSCFSLAAKPCKECSQGDKLTWFSIKFDPNNDGVIKNCGDSEKKHCEKGNTW